MERLEPHFAALQDVSDALEECEILSLNPWYNGICYVLARAVMAKDAPINDPHLTRSNLRVRVLEVSEHAVGVFDLPVQPYINFVQPVPNNRFLIGSSRTGFSQSRRAYDHNALVVTDGGELVSSFSLGDAVEDVQATSDGKLWVSYFDEGYGGPPRLDRRGYRSTESMLIQWSSDGDILYDHPADILDCYAINLEHDRSLWACYGPRCPLVRITPDSVDSVYPPTIRCAKAFAVSRHGVLFGPGYGVDDAGDQADLTRIWSQYEFAEMTLEPRQRFLSPERLKPGDFYAARGSFVFWLDRGLVRRLDMNEL